jgi:hypothetical protein
LAHIFGLPPSEIAMHPAEGNMSSELSLMCDDIHHFINQMTDAKIHFDAVQNGRTLDLWNSRYFESVSKTN